jgi:hypothetical protein
MAIAPVNFYASFDLVPVFQWEPVEPTQDDTTAAHPAPVNIESGGLDTQPDPAQTADTPASTEMRLVFKGFEWVFTPGVATFPRPDWMDGVTAGCNEEADPTNQDDERKKRVDEAERARLAALARPDVDPMSSDDVSSTTKFTIDHDDDWS